MTEDAGCRQPGLRLPDFIVGGAPRSGTTWLYRLLERHPQIYMAQPLQPEPKFFLVDDLYARGLEYYSSQWFAQAPAGRVLGEKTTNYLESRTAAERIRRHLPGVKLVFNLREPGARAYSNYLWSKQNGMEAEDFETALAREDEREAQGPAHLRFARPHAYFSRGLYGELLEPYLEFFGGGQVLCQRYEDIRTQPGELAIQLHRFLAVEPRPQDAEGIGVVRGSDPAAAPMPPRARRMLTERYAESNARLARLLGTDFVEGWMDV